jgi:hypothetical protein
MACIPVSIIVNNLESAYTNAPNPVSVFTYPISNVNLNITYNGSSSIPSQTGNYNLSINIVDTVTYCANTFTGIYSIVGGLSWENYVLGWGLDISQSGTQSQKSYSYANSGLLGVQKIAGGDGFSVALMSDNTVQTWGTGNLYGQQNIPNISPNYIRDIFTSNTTTFIIDYSGNLTGCGYLFNTSGNGYTGNSIFDLPPTLTGISGVAGGDYYAIAFPSNKTRVVTGWGTSSKTFFTFTAGFGSTGINDISASNYGYGLLSGTTAKPFGPGSNGEFSWTSAQGLNVRKISCADTCSVLLYNNNTISGFGKFLNATGGIINFTIPDTSIQGKILDASVSSTHVGLILSGYVNPAPDALPICTSLVYG